MHSAAYLVILSLHLLFYTAKTATLPRIHDPSRTTNASSTHPLFPRSIHCEVPGTSTILLIETADLKLYPYRMAQVLLEAQKRIRLKLHQGGNRPLFLSEVPFTIVSWRLQLQFEPSPLVSPGVVSLTWQLLDDTIRGLFDCMYDEKSYHQLYATIARETATHLQGKGHVSLRPLTGTSATDS